MYVSWRVGIGIYRNTRWCVNTFLAGNLLCVWAFNKKDVELKRSFANLLNCLAIFDSVFLTCILLQYSMPTLSEHYLVCTLCFISFQQRHLILHIRIGTVIKWGQAAVSSDNTELYSKRGCNVHPSKWFTSSCWFLVAGVDPAPSHPHHPPHHPHHTDWQCVHGDNWQI